MGLWDSYKWSGKNNSLCQHKTHLQYSVREKTVTNYIYYLNTILFTYPSFFRTRKQNFVSGFVKNRDRAGNFTTHLARKFSHGQGIVFFTVPRVWPDWEERGKFPRIFLVFRRFLLHRRVARIFNNKLRRFLPLHIGRFSNIYRINSYRIKTLPCWSEKSCWVVLDC